MASGTFTLILNSPATVDADLTLTPVTGLSIPVAPGTVVGTAKVTKAGWVGTISIDNPAFVAGGASPNYTIVAAVALTLASYTANVTVLP
jgi:hypothetical protein